LSALVAAALARGGGAARACVAAFTVVAVAAARVAHSALTRRELTAVRIGAGRAPSAPSGTRVLASG
jgi:hypothetical protein